MEALPLDTYASVHKRLDLNQNPCAAVRVSLPVDGVTFSGTNLIGSIDRIGAEYIVFMPAGSKKMYIQHPKFHELEVVFGHYGIERLESLATYRVTVNVPQSGAPQQKMQTLTIKVTPADAIVQIDGDIVEGTAIALSVGTHRYNVASKGYYPQEGTVEVNENIPAKLLIELDRKTASLTTPSQSVAVTAPTQPSQPVSSQPQQLESSQTPKPQPQPSQQPVQNYDEDLSEENGPTGEIFTVVEEMPQFPGGESALQQFIKNNLKYPEIALENGISGRVICTFVIDGKGKVTEVKVLRSVDPSLDKEAVRVISIMPVWKPGRQQGKPVRVRITLPVTFNLTHIAASPPFEKFFESSNRLYRLLQAGWLCSEKLILR